MVEGPKVHLKKERLEKQLYGKQLLHVLHTTSKGSNASNGGDNKTPVGAIAENRKGTNTVAQGMVLYALIVLGKELFLHFSSSPHLNTTTITTADDAAENAHDGASISSLLLRLHFGMSGSERVVEESLQQAFAAQQHPLQADNTKNRKTFCGKILFQTSPIHSTATVLYLYDTSIRIVSTDHHHISNSLLPEILARQALDVNHPAFCIPRVVDAIAQKYFQPSEQAHKRARLTTNITATLSAETVCIQEVLLDQAVLPGVGNIIKCEALFAAQINPYQPLLSIPIGTDLDINTPKTLMHLLHCTQSFSIAWYEASKKHRDIAKGIYQKQVCDVCQQSVRLERSGNGMQRITYYCQHCQPMLGSSPITSSSSGTEQAVIHADWKCEFCGYNNSATIDICEICADCKPKTATISNIIVRPSNSGTAQIDTAISISTSTISSQPPVSTIQPATCQQCHQPAILLRVRKQNSPNLHRLFWGCKQKKCTFFSWADSNFPRCPNASSPSAGKHYTVLRRVLKAGTNNGKNFYSCQACSFFQWEEGRWVKGITGSAIDIPL